MFEVLSGVAEDGSLLGYDAFVGCSWRLRHIASSQLRPATTHPVMKRYL